MIYYGAVVIVVELEANIGDILDITDFVTVHVEQELDKLLNGEISIALSQSYKSQDE